MSNAPPIHPGETVTDDAVIRVYAGLLQKTLPKDEWTHGAHLCAGTMILREVGLEAAEATMPDAIRHYNEAVGGENTDSEGYHHTITLFYLRVLNKNLAGRWFESVGALATFVLNGSIADRAYPLRYYSKDLLFSVKARRGWVSPDLQAL